ncbi:unnamed protein product [Penicillium pancosmium]
MQAKVAVVTGGADGFGATITDRFHQEGYQVIIIDINKEKGEQKASGGPNIHFLFGDVTQQDTWEQALALARDRFGRLDIVVNNAGITGAQSPVHTKDMAEYELTFNVNVRPIFCSARSIVPFMVEQGNGVFVNITSTGCTRPRPGFAFYNASKAAVATKTMALEYAPTVRFNCIAPAVGNTSMLQASIGSGADSRERLQKIEDLLPMKRVAQPMDIANAVWYLATEQSSFVTGTTLEVDGGRGI